MKLTTAPNRTRRRVVAALAVIGVFATGAATAGAGVSDPTEATGAGEDTTATTEAAEGTAASGDSASVTETSVDPDAVVRRAESALGTILVDQEGFTLYAFFADTDGESTCTGECLANWPAAVVEDTDLNVGNLDPALFSTVENPEAGTMLKAGDWPLYRFVGDAAPGDVNGQGLDQNGGLWFVVGPDGTPANIVNTRETDEFGTILVNAEGFTMYAFLNDTEGESTCVDDCATNWPPALVGEANIDVLDPDLYITVEHPDGTMLRIGDWPLYTFAGDEAPGDTNGQGVDEVWYVVGPDGQPIQDAEEGEQSGSSVPSGTETPATTGAPETTG
jgi:predicted lipoprotein with Yx(FWY)xxD motif